MLADRPIETAGPELDPRLLSQLVALADHRDLGRAAAALSLSSRTLVRGIRELERETGEPLLKPATRHTELTPTGERLADGGRRVLRALARFSDAAREEHTRVRVAHVADCDTLETVLASVPALRVRESRLADGEQLVAVAEHRLDIAVCTDDSPLVPGLADALIREDPLMLLGDPAAGVIHTVYGAHWRAHDVAVAALIRERGWDALGVESAAGSGRELRALMREAGERALLVPSSVLRSGDAVPTGVRLRWRAVWRVADDHGAVRAVIAAAIDLRSAWCG